MKKSKKRILSILIAGIVAESLISPLNSTKASAVTTVTQKSKDVQQTVTKNITVNDNLLEPNQSIFPTSRYSYLNARTANVVGAIDLNGAKSIKNTITGQYMGYPDSVWNNDNGVKFITACKTAAEIGGSDLGFNSSSTACTISTDINWNGSTSLFYQNNEFQLRIVGPGTDFNTPDNTNRLCIDSGSDIPSLYGCIIPSNFKNTWHKITIEIATGEFDNPQNAIYIDGVKQSLMYFYNSKPSSYTSKNYIHVDKIANTNIMSEDGNSMWVSGRAGLNIYNRLLSDTEVAYEYKDSDVNPNFWNSEFFGSTNAAGNLEYGTCYTKAGTGGINDYNYLRIMSKENETSDSAAYLDSIPCSPHTVYTISAYVKIPKSGTYNKHSFNGCNILFPVVDNANPSVVGSSGNCYTACNWKRIWVTFETGSSTAMELRIDRSDIPEIDITALKLEQSDHPTPFISYGQSATYDFTHDLLPELNPTYGINNTMSYNEAGYLPSALSASKISFTPTNRKWNYSSPIELQEHFTHTDTKNNLSSKDDSQFADSYYVNQDGYSGSIPRTGINWAENWQKNRYSDTQCSSQISQYYENLNQWNYPNSVPVNVYDAATNQNVTGNIGLSRAPYAIMSAVKTVHSISPGIVKYRHDYTNEWVPWLSDNQDTYFGGSYSFDWPMPRPFQDYYGPDRDTGTWRLSNYHWGDDRAYSAAEEGEPYWLSDGEYGGTHENSWARGVCLDYVRTAVFSKYKADYVGQVKLPDYISSYNGTANYEGTFTKTETQPGYYTSNQWTVTINYSGKEQAIDNPPTASFTMNSKIHVGEKLNIASNNYDTDPWDSIASSEWFYKNYVSDSDASNPNSDYISTDLNSLTTFNKTGRYAVRNKVTDIGNSPYSGPYSNEYNGTVNCWHDVKVYPVNTKPTALFSVDRQVKPGQALTYIDKSAPNDNVMGYNGSITDKVTEWHWQWSTDRDNWIDGQPTSFSSEGVYYIRLQVRDNGNYIEPSQDTNNDSLDDRLWSDWSNPETVVVAENIKPVNIHADSIEVLDTNGNSVSKVINGQKYRIKFVIENNTDNTITGLFNTSFGLDVMTTDNVITLGLLPHTPVTLYSKYFVEDNNSMNAACYDAYANNTGTIIETNNDDNALSITLPLVNDSNNNLIAPTAQFTVSSPVLINQTLTYNDTSHVNQSGASIINRDWKWSTDGLVWNNFWQPASFSTPGTYYIEEQVEDSNELYSEWCIQKVKVIVPTPVNDNLTVDQYTYKQDDNTYWVKPGDTFGITTRSYFPSDYGIYPSKTYLMLAKSNNSDTDAAPQEWDSISSKYDFGSMFNNELTAAGNNVAVQNQINGNNYLNALHQFTAKNDGSIFNLYSKSGYLYGMTEYSNSYTNSGKAIKVDGIAPGYDSIYDYQTGTVDSNVSTNAALDDNLMLNLSVNNLFDKGSGVNAVYVKLYPTGQESNAKQLSLRLENSNGDWDLNNIDAYALFKSADINIDFYAADNVGNVGKIGNIKKNLLTVRAEIAPYDTPDFSGVPTLEKGQKAVLKIYTTGYADTLNITFPKELTDKDNSLNKTMKIVPQAHAETDVIFNVPRYIDEKQYTVKVLATNSVNNTTKEADPQFNVNDDILNGLRTCTIDDNP